MKAVTRAGVSLPLHSHDSTFRVPGSTFRRSRPGPEKQLLGSFLESVPLHVPRGCRATVFSEPRLESGFPDLVIVVWREQAAREWRRERASLEAVDLRIAHFLHRARRADTNQLSGYFGRRVTDHLEKLLEADLVRRDGDSWVPRALRHTFAASKIISIEAKVGDWSRVLAQAQLNTWFASKSYVLVPKPPAAEQLDEARRQGIGVCSLDCGRVAEVPSDVTRLPRSYASWLLNDWAWRYDEELDGHN